MKYRIKIDVLLLLGIIIVLIVSVNKNHKITYQIKNKKNSFQVEEKYQKRKEKYKDIYHITIKTKHTSFSYQIHYKFNYKKRIIKQIKYYKDHDYECILPIFEHHKTLTDIICKKDEQYYNYYDIKGENKELDQYVQKIKEYQFNQFDDQLKEQQTKKNITVYQNINLFSDRFVVDHYKGIFIIDRDKIKNIKLFSKDIYKKKNKILNGKYYVVADYNQKYEFYEWYKINITNGKISKIKSPHSISFHSYIQGNQNENVYLFDRSNKIQYKINVLESLVQKINSDNIKVLELNHWKEVSPYQASKEEIYFNPYTIKNTSYIRIDKIGQKNTGYYYYYQKKNNQYYVYRSSQIKKKEKKYLFRLERIDRIMYKDDKIYYIDDNVLKVYSDLTGVKTILKNSEFRFNNNLNCYIY